MKRGIPLMMLMIIGLAPNLLAKEIYPFAHKSQTIRFQTLTSDLRCLVCQNQTLAESDAPLAADLRQKIYHMIKAGNTNTQIKGFLLARYGDFVLDKPPLQTNTYLLWGAPFALLILGFLFLAWFVRQQKIRQDNI